jgi:hypothetical protein
VLTRLWRSDLNSAQSNRPWNQKATVVGGQTPDESNAPVVTSDYFASDRTISSHDRSPFAAGFDEPDEDCMGMNLMLKIPLRSRK